MIPSTPLSRRKMLATRVTWAALWIVAVQALPVAFHLEWSSPTGPFWPALLGATFLIACPPLGALRARVAQESEPDSDFPSDFPSDFASGLPSGLLLALSSAVFALAALIPALLIGRPPEASALAALALFPLAACARTTRASERPGYALVFLTATLAMLAGTSEPGTNEPGSVVSGSSGLDGGRAWPVSVTIGEGSGPRMALDGFSPLLVPGDFLEGETRQVSAWMVGPSEVEDWGLFADGVPARPLEGASSFRLPAWANRAGPSMEASGRRLPLAPILAVLVGLVGCVAVQRTASFRALVRVGAHGLIGIGAAAAVYSLGDPGAVQATSGGATVLEGRRLGDGSTEWVSIQRSFGVFEWSGGALEGAFSGEVAVDGRRGIARTERDLRPGLEAARIVAVEPRAFIDWRRTFEAGLRILLPEVNTWGAFDSAWERTSGGEWRAIGPWGMGQALPDPVPNDEAEGSRRLPGWCAGGLPQGRSVFIGLLAQDDPEESPTWVRLLGFRP